MGRKRTISDDQIAVALAAYGCRDLTARTAAALAGISMGSLMKAARGVGINRLPLKGERPTQADRKRERAHLLFESAGRLIEEGRALIEEAERLDQIHARQR